MSFDFEKSFTYIAKDPEWGSKLLAGSGLMLAAFVLLLMPVIGLILDNLFVTIFLLAISFVIFSILQFAILGYGCKIAKNLIDNPDETMLPDWIKSFWNHVTVGFKYTIGCLLFFIPIYVLIFFLALIPFVMIVGSDLPKAVMMIGIPLLFLFVMLLIFLYIFALLFLPLFSANFMKDFKIISFINFKEAFGMLKGHWCDYFIMLLLFLALTCLAGTVGTILFYTIIGIVLLPVLYFYGFLVFVNICAQFMTTLNNPSEKIEEKPENNDETPQE